MLTPEQRVDKVRRLAIFEIMENSPITLHPRDMVDSVKAGKIFNALLKLKDKDGNPLIYIADEQSLPETTYDKEGVIGYILPDAEAVIISMPHNKEYLVYGEKVGIDKMLKANFRKIIEVKE